MRLNVNGEPLEVRARNLDALIAELDYPAELVATAVNEQFVRAKERAATALDEHDRVEILTPRQGG
ncbi:sulfur carrier protein ThiS [uncultured Rhodoblastus sp.]|uniref:sulfur carrier protein ThiS n=1 Tax=uncultured Rhodoblastus sp. TaxID=543037 RepID=UPI0025D58A52|nr:sulfur carrier protein ThiS [uncultured Rhodoblastus sp.]